MELTGKIIAVLPERRGIAQRTGAEWVCASYVLETVGDYPRRMNFEVFGSDRIAQFNIQQGELLTVSFDIDAREGRDGRWFNSIRAFRVDRGAVQQPAYGAQPVAQPFNAQPVATQPFNAQPVAAQPAQPVAQPFPPAQPTMGEMDSNEQLPF